MYATKAYRNMIITLLAAASSMDAAEGFSELAHQKKKLRTVRTLLYQVAEDGMEHIEQEQLGQMLRFCKSGNLEIDIRYKSVPAEYVYIRREVLDRLTAGSLSECALCDPDKHTARKCQTRKDLLSAGIDPRSDGVCPYQML